MGDVNKEAVADNKEMEPAEAGAEGTEAVKDSQCTKEDEDPMSSDPIAMKCKEAFSMIWPEDELIINKEKIGALLKVVLGDLYNDEVCNILIDAMTPDEDGNIALENFFHTFSLDCWSHDSLAAMQLVLTNSPEVVNQLANWKSVLSTLGFDLGDTEVQQLINKANECAKEILKLALERSSRATPEELKKAQIDIFKALCDKLTKLACTTSAEENMINSSTENNEK